MIDAATIQDGLHFGLDEIIYHAIPALSASGIKNILISPVDFYARSWLNPDKPREDEDDVKEWQTVGKAFHKRVLEGKTAFASHYASSFVPPVNALKTIEELKAGLDGVGASYPKTGRRDALMALAANAGLPIYDVLRDDYEAEHAGKTFLSEGLLHDIEIAAAMIELHPELSRFFTGGYPEVSVLWTEGDVRFKARWDYVKPKAIIDLKTFSNPMNKPIDAALYACMASKKYHIQAAMYLRAADIARTFANDRTRIHGSDSPSDEWLTQFASAEEHGFYFCWQQKGIAPLARGKKFPRSLMYHAGTTAIEQGIEVYRRCMEKFGTGRWIDDTPVDSFDDSFFPPWAMEI